MMHNESGGNWIRGCPRPILFGAKASLNMMFRCFFAPLSSPTNGRGAVGYKTRATERSRNQ